MVFCGARAGVSLTQQPRQRLTRVVQEGEYRIVAKRFLPRRRSVLLLGMTLDNGRINIDHQTRHLPVGGLGQGKTTTVAARLGSLRPRQLTRRRPRRTQRRDRLGVNRVQHPPHRGIAGHHTEQLGLIPQHRDIADRLTAIGEQHRYIQGDPARSMTAIPLPQRDERLHEAGGQAGHLGNIGKQTGTGMPDHTPPIPTDFDLRTRTGSLHQGSASHIWRS